MKISPIINDDFQYNNLPCKGFVSHNIQYGLYSYVRNFKDAVEYAETNPIKYSNLIKFLNIKSNFAKKYADIILENMGIVMKRFGRSCELNWHSSKKSPLNQLFVIESSDSYYKHICGELKLQNSYAQDLAAINTFTNESLGKINPYETNLKFKIMRNHDNFADNFAPEMEFWFVEDNLIDANKILFKNNKEKQNSSVEHLGEIEKESREFVKEFKHIFGNTRKFW